MKELITTQNQTAGTRVDWANVRTNFLLPEDQAYLNGATFSALPKPVFDAQVGLMRSAEANPTSEAAWRNKTKIFFDMQKRVAAYLGCNPEDMTLHYNVTNALNQAFFSMTWPAGGEILASDCEYGAIRNAAQSVADRNGMTFRKFKLVRCPSSNQEAIDCVLNALSEKTAVVLLSHIISGHGLHVPVAEIAVALSKRNIRFIVDGAHGPGLLPLNLGETQIDFYGGNLHKWFMGPKGTAFLYVKRSLHTRMKPHIVGWSGDNMDNCYRAMEGKFGTQYAFPYVFGFQGLRDVSPFLALSAALDFHESIGEENIIRRIRELAMYARKRIGDETGWTCISPEPEMHAGPVMFVPPAGREYQKKLTRHLLETHKITILSSDLPPYGLRVSAHIWNSEEHIDRLAAALRDMT